MRISQQEGFKDDKLIFKEVCSLNLVESELGSQSSSKLLHKGEILFKLIASDPLRTYERYN
jgi:hypothetical protein